MYPGQNSAEYGVLHCPERDRLIAEYLDVVSQLNSTVVKEQVQRALRLQRTLAVHCQEHKC